jgi:membrane-associated protein
MIAGASKMKRSRFMFFNVFGGLFWGVGVTLIGYLFGSAVPGIEHYIEPTLIAVTILTLGTVVYHLMREKETRKRIWQKVKLVLRNFALNKKVD